MRAVVSRSGSHGATIAKHRSRRRPVCAAVAHCPIRMGRCRVPLFPKIAIGLFGAPLTDSSGLVASIPQPSRIDEPESAENVAIINFAGHHAASVFNCAHHWIERRAAGFDHIEASLANLSRSATQGACGSATISSSGLDSVNHFCSPAFDVLTCTPAKNPCQLASQAFSFFPSCSRSSLFCTYSPQVPLHRGVGLARSL